MKTNYGSKHKKRRASYLERVREKEGKKVALERARKVFGPNIQQVPIGHSKEVEFLYNAMFPDYPKI